jgi:hypothetical protein
MAQQDVTKFAREYLAQHPDVKEKIDRISDQNQFVAAVHEAGSRAGFDFSADDVRAVLAERLGELSDVQLDNVSGGITCRKAGGGQQEYLTVTMSDLLVSS